jgi:ribonuclease P protein subunit RPR2
MEKPQTLGRGSRRIAKRTSRRIALERMEILLELAKKTAPQSIELAQRYVDLARRIGMRYKVRLPPELRRLICRRCKGLIIPGLNARVRIQQRREAHIAITCLSCGGINRIPLKERERSQVKNLQWFCTA